MRESAVTAARRVDLERADAVGGAGEHFGTVEAERIWPDRPISPAFAAREAAKAEDEARVEAERVETEAKAAASREAARREWMKAEALADALVSIARAKARAGHDLTVWSPAEAQHVLNAFGLFSDAQGAPAPELPGAFRGESDPAAIARGAAVGAILSGA